MESYQRQQSFSYGGKGSQERVLMYRVDVPAKLHVSELLPCPVGVKLRGAHEGEVHTEAAVHRRTIQANEYTVRHRRPRRILRVAIETYLRITTHYNYHWTLTLYCSGFSNIHTLFAGIERNLWNIASISFLLGPESAIFDVLSLSHRRQSAKQMSNSCHLYTFT